MKTAKKALLLTVCALVLVAATVFGTVAYLSDSKAVENTFTVGQIQIDLDETVVKPNGVPANHPAIREPHGNEYHILPGCEYIKDPIVWFADNNDEAYVYVKVENNMEPAVKTADLVEQMKSHDWEQLTYVEMVDDDPDHDVVHTIDNVFFQKVPANHSGKAVALPVFDGFTVDMALTADDLADCGTTINVTAYAVQTAAWMEQWPDTSMHRASAGYVWMQTFGAPEIV